MPPTQILNMHKIGRRVPEGCVYVGRPTKWGNPFKVGAGRRGEAIERFREYARKRIKREPDWLNGLKDATALVCWCSPLPCHAQVLVELMNAGNSPTVQDDIQPS